MGTSIPVTIGLRTFPSKTAAAAAFRGIRDKYRDGVPILEQDEVELLLGLVAVHPESLHKRGEGVAAFYVDTAPGHPTRCFFIRRVDGSTTDISWNEALRPTTPIRRLRAACREAILDQKMQFKDAQWPPRDLQPRTCPITQKKFSRDQAHIDHTPPQTLVALVDDWLRSEDLSIEDVAIDCTGDMRSVDTFDDESQRASWQAYHRNHANLRVISAGGNLLQGGRDLGF
jgi:hypothetical protein